MTKRLGYIDSKTIVMTDRRKMDCDYHYKGLVLKCLFDFDNPFPIMGMYLDDIDLMDLQVMRVLWVNKAFLARVLLDGIDAYNRHWSSIRTVKQKEVNNG